MRKIIYLFIILFIYAGSIYAQENIGLSAHMTEIKDRIIGEWYQESENGRPVKESVKFVFRNDGTGSAVIKPPVIVEKEDFTWIVTRNGSNEWSLSRVQKESGKKENAPLRFERNCLMLGTRCLKKIHLDSSSESENKNADINDKIVGDWYLESENGRPAEVSIQYSFKKDGSGSVVLNAPEIEEKKEFKWNVSELPDGKWTFLVLEKGMKKEKGVPLRFDDDCLMINQSCLKKINSASESENKKAEIINKMVGEWYMESDNGRPVKESLQFVFRKDGTGSAVMKAKGKEEKKDFSWTVSEQSAGQWRFSAVEKERGRKEGGSVRFEGDCLMIDKSCLKKVNSNAISDNDKRKEEMMSKIVGDWVMETENGKSVEVSIQFSFRKDGTGTGTASAEGKVEQKKFNWSVSEKSLNEWVMSVTEKGKDTKEEGPIRFEGDCLMVENSCFKKIDPSSNHHAEKKKNDIINKIVGTWAFSENGNLVPDSLQFSFRKDGTGTAVGDIDGKVEQKEFNWTVSEKVPNEWVMSVTEKEKGTKEEGPIRFEGECLMVDKDCLKKVDPPSAAETEKRKDEIIKKITGDWEMETEKGKPVPYGETVKVSFFKDGKGKTVTETADRKTKTEDFIWSISLKNKDQWLISFKEENGRRSRIETKEISFKETRLFIGELGLKKRNGSDSNSNPVNSAEVINGIIFHLKTRWSRQTE